MSEEDVLNSGWSSLCCHQRRSGGDGLSDVGRSRERLASWELLICGGWLGDEARCLLRVSACGLLHRGRFCDRTQEAVVMMLVSGRNVSLSIGHAPLCAVVYSQRVRNIM